MTHRFDCHFINGKWTPSTGDAKIKVENPATREIFATVPDGTIEDVDRAVAAAKAAQPAWEKVPMAERVALMRRVIDYLKARADEITELEVKELGAPVTFTRNLHVNYPIARIVSFTDLADEAPRPLPTSPSPPARANRSASSPASPLGTILWVRSCRRCRPPF